MARSDRPWSWFRRASKVSSSTTTGEEQPKPESGSKMAPKPKEIHPPMYPPNSSSRRSVVHSTKGIVSATQPLAAQAGIKILEKGGNAADAAVAVAAALNITEPSATGIGGDAFCLFYDAKTKKVLAMNASGRSNSTLTLDDIRQRLKLKDGQDGLIPTESVLSATVPGAAAGWVDAVEKFGSGKVTLEEILTPAIKLGEEGFPCSELSSYFWHRSENMIRNASDNGHEMLKADQNAPKGCRAPRPGEIMKNPTLANTFRLLGKHGKKGFYEGSVAEAYVQVVKDHGGATTLDDLKRHAELGSEEVDAISLTYTGQGVNPEFGGLRVWEHPPNGQGIVALMALGILQELEKAGKIRKWTKQDHNKAEHLHACIEALRIAFGDAHWWVTDPATSKVPTQELISSDYLKERAKIFDPKKAAPGYIDHGSPAHNHSDTVYFCVTDSEGNGMSFINSNYSGFGTAIIPKGCGFTLQNRGSNFSLQPGHPNVYAPNKRPYHTIIPAIITNPSDDSLNSVYGVMGGFMQPQGHVQVLLNQFVFGMTPQAALDAPRFCIGAGLPEEGQVMSKVIFLEDGIAPEAAQQLTKMGHEVSIMSGHGRSLFGRGQIIRSRFEEGQQIFSAGSDPRGDGAAYPVI